MSKVLSPLALLFYYPFFPQQPVVITDSRLVESAFKWNLDYLRSNIGDGIFNVYESPNHLFKYYDEKKLDKRLPGNNGPFRPPTKRLEMKFDEFYDLMKRPAERDKRYKSNYDFPFVCICYQADYILLCIFPLKKTEKILLICDLLADVSVIENGI